MSLSALSVRPILPYERARFDETLAAEHWLGTGLVGEVMRYVAEEDGNWVALLGFGSAALCVRPREELLSWSDQQRYRRLRYLTNNQRFCVHLRPRGIYTTSGAPPRVSAPSHGALPVVGTPVRNSVATTPRAWLVAEREDG